MKLETQFKPEAPGLFLDVPMDVYQAAPGESNSGLNLLNDSPKFYRLWKDGKYVREETPAMAMGTMFHELNVDRRRPRYHERPATYGPDNKPWSGNATICKEWLKAHSDLPVLKPDEVEQLRKSALLIQESRAAMDLLTGGHPEVSIFATQDGTGRLLKGRIDYLKIDGKRAIITDLKSTIDGCTKAFSREILTRSYFKQFAMYRRILHKLGFDQVDVYLIILEKGEMMRVRVRQLAPAALDHGDKSLDSDLALLHKFSVGRFWPDYADDEQSEVITMIDLPDFVYGDIDNLTGMTEAAA